MSILFYNADILTQNGIIKKGYLGIVDGYIDYISENSPRLDYAVRYNMTGKLLIPGLYNMHTHTAMSLMRGVGSGLPLDRWLTEAIFPVEAKLDEKSVRVGSTISIMEMLAGGVVSFTDMYDKCMATAEIVLSSGIKANLSRAIMGFDKNEPYEKNFRVKESIDLFKQISALGEDRLKADFSVHGEYTSYEALIESYAKEISTYGGRVHIHLSETLKEHEECKARNAGRTPTKVFFDAGLFSTSTIAAHCVYVEDEDIEILSECGVSVVHCPSSNLKLASGVLNVKKLIDCGINICVGTDGSASNNNQNIFEELHIAALLASVATQNPQAIDAREWLTIATKNSAMAQGRMDCGEIAVGKRADIAVISLEEPHMHAFNSDCDLLIYSAQASDICMTIVDGKILYNNGEYLTIDAEKAYYELDEVFLKLF